VTERRLLACALAAVLALAPQATGVAGGQDPTPAPAQHEPRAEAGAASKAYDALVLRPFGAVQTAVGAAVFVIFYPAALATGMSEDLTEICVSEPADQTFQKPLGEP